MNQRHPHERVVEPMPGLDDLADALRSMRTRDELKRFLRDLCTLSELEALAHRWQTARLVDEGVPYHEIAHRVPPPPATGTAGAPGAGRVPARPRADPGQGASKMTASFTRAGADGRLSLAVPAKGRMAEPAL